MQKLAALHAFIENLNLFAAEQMESVADEVVITPACRGTGVQGEIVVLEKKYDAVFFIERYPHGKVSEDILLANISIWLLENDADRQESMTFELNVEVLDNQTANIEFAIAFDEQVLANESVGGALVFLSKEYQL